MGPGKSDPPNHSCFVSVVGALSLVNVLTCRSLLVKGLEATAYGRGRWFVELLSRRLAPPNVTAMVQRPTTCRFSGSAVVIRI